MRLALAAALLGMIPLSIAEHYHRPLPPKDPHDTLVAAPDSALVPRAPVPVAAPERVSFAGAIDDLDFLAHVNPGLKFPE